MATPGLFAREPLEQPSERQRHYFSSILAVEPGVGGGFERYNPVFEAAEPGFLGRLPLLFLDNSVDSLLNVLLVGRADLFGGEPTGSEPLQPVICD